MAQQFIRIGQAAKLLGKTPRQLRRMEDNGDLIPHHHSGGQRFYDLAEIEDLACVDRDMRQVVESATVTVAPATVQQDGTPHRLPGQTVREMLEEIPPPHTHNAAVAAVRWRKELLELEAQRREYIPATSVAQAISEFLEAFRTAFGEAFCRRMESEWSVDYDWMYSYAAEQETALCDLINEWADRELG